MVHQAIAKYALLFTLLGGVAQILSFTYHPCGRSNRRRIRKIQEKDCILQLPPSSKYVLKILNTHYHSNDSNQLLSVEPINGEPELNTSLDQIVPYNRRAIITSLLAATTILGNDILQPVKANAYYEKSFPLELQAVDGEVDSRSRKINKITNIEKQKVEETRFLTGNKVISSTIWAGALWLWSGSRSNPVATPLANVLYKKDSEKWLQDRNEGWFAALPWEFLVILSFIYLAFGFLFDILVVFITSSTDPTFDISATASTTTAISVQLASVCLIAGGSLELGRIFSGEKQQTKQEGLRSTQLEEEFDLFADKRLIVSKSTTKNVHRSDIISAFRRYYAKYRVRPSDTDQQRNDLDNVTDLEIERLIRNWAKYRVSVDMTPAGFFYGVEINRDADVFVSR